MVAWRVEGGEGREKGKSKIYQDTISIIVPRIKNYIMIEKEKIYIYTQ